MTNQQVIDGSWTSLKGHIQATWGHITENDLQRAKGDLNQIVGLIQEKTGEAREQIEAKLEGMKARASEQAQETYDWVSEGVQQGYAQAEAVVQQRPLESVAIAFGSGLIAGVITGLIIRSR